MEVMQVGAGSNLVGGMADSGEEEARARVPQVVQAASTPKIAAALLEEVDAEGWGEGFRANLPRIRAPVTAEEIEDGDGEAGSGSESEASYDTALERLAASSALSSQYGSPKSGSIFGSDAGDMLGKRLKEVLSANSWEEGLDLEDESRPEMDPASSSAAAGLMPVAKVTADDDPLNGGGNGYIYSDDEEVEEEEEYEYEEEEEDELRRGMSSPAPPPTAAAAAVVVPALEGSGRKSSSFRHTRFPSAAGLPVAGDETDVLGAWEPHTVAVAEKQQLGEVSGPAPLTAVAGTGDKDENPALPTPGVAADGGSVTAPAVKVREAAGEGLEESVKPRDDEEAGGQQESIQSQVPQGKVETQKEDEDAKETTDTPRGAVEHSHTTDLQADASHEEEPPPSVRVEATSTNPDVPSSTAADVQCEAEEKAANLTPTEDGKSTTQPQVKDLSTNDESKHHNLADLLHQEADVEKPPPPSTTSPFPPPPTTAAAGASNPHLRKIFRAAHSFSKATTKRTAKMARKTARVLQVPSVPCFPGHRKKASHHSDDDLR